MDLPRVRSQRSHNLLKITGIYVAQSFGVLAGFVLFFSCCERSSGIFIYGEKHGSALATSNCELQRSLELVPLVWVLGVQERLHAEEAESEQMGVEGSVQGR